MSTQTQRTGSNRLADSTSPYLLQHKDNPVHWYEWGDEAFEKARKEDKPVFLSIGYAACHWCHVMEHESFESEEVARILNEHFVSIKVDREERPDIDAVYMAYTQALTRRGGWPMSVWLKPDGRPFYAGTYFPKEQFMALITNIAETWKSDRDRITRGAEGAREFLDRWAAPPAPAEGVIAQEQIDQAARAVARRFDRRKGGIAGGSNKFPPTMSMDLLLRVYQRTRESSLFEAVEVTLDQMARGGIYDHLAGGICRYSTDQDWLVPHFEKMLYDQATVSAIYLDGYQAAKKPLWRETAESIFNYVLTDLQSPEGGFYSSRDADSEGLEGKFYIWTLDEVREILGEEEGKLCAAYFDITETGNWFERFGHAPPGPKNILHIRMPPETFAKVHGLHVDDLKRRIETWREKLLAARAKRVPPPLDDKVLTSWNGLMIAALAKGGRILDEPKYTQAAGTAAQFILNHLRKNERLLRTYRRGRARYTGYLDDYAFFVEGLLNLYEATFDRKWLDTALELTETSIQSYYDETGGGFFFTAANGEELLVRSKNPHDGAIPAGNSVHAMNLLRLAIYFNRKDFREKAESIFRAFGKDAVEAPLAFERLFCAADFYHDRVKEIAVIGDPDDSATKALLRTVYDAHLPNKVVAGAAEAVPMEYDLPLLTGKTLRQGRPTAYVCENYRCKLPVTEPGDLARQLAAGFSAKEPSEQE